MVHSLLPVPFADAARRQLFAAMQAALLAEPDVPTTVLLGNLGAFTPIEADALLVHPTGAVLIVLVPPGGHLTIPALAYGTWQLDGQPLASHAGTDNPFEQYHQQRPAALAWLRAQLGPAISDCQGIALFGGPLTFGPEVESQLDQHPDAADFQLVGGVALLAARLRTAAATLNAGLPASTLRTWVTQLAAESAPEVEPTTYLPINYLEQKFRQLWSWLGAEDIPADPPYGGVPLAYPQQQEQARLQQLRHELQAELHQQRQEATAREATRTQELTQLRQQLAQAGLSATERRAEQQATTALEEELRAARAELATRNQELDARIQQLGLLIKQLQAPGKPTVAVALAYPPAAQPAASAQRPAANTHAVRALAGAPGTAAFRRLRQAERWGLVVLVLAGMGAGTWGVARLAQPPRPRSATAAAHRRKAASLTEEGLTPNVVYVVDSTLAAPAPADTTNASLYSVDSEPVGNVGAAAPAPSLAKQPADSVAAPAALSPTAPVPTTKPDSAATPSPSP